MAQLRVFDEDQVHRLLDYETFDSAPAGGLSGALEDLVAARLLVELDGC